MQEINCPHCGKAFKIDESGYADILKQVRDSEFDQALHDRLALAEKEKQAAVELAMAKAASELQKKAATKDAEIQDLKAKLDAGEITRQLAVNEALSQVQKERDALANDLEQAKHDKEVAVELAKSKSLNELQKTAGAKDAEIQALKAQLDAIETAKKLAITEAVSAVEKERDREDTIERLRDLKARLSTKMIGETLEQHCETEFNRIRAMAFPRAHFEKDNDSRSGSKGDYIFRESDASGTEIVSIMFEMKNESDTTATKTKNEDFLKELDKDRIEKGCEYAVLVTLLEPESELYNAGIVDVFHRYSKMYVVRPQFFLPIISLLRNAALNSLQYKSELALVKSQNIDITNFENELDSFKAAFGKNYELASKRFQTAIDEIDKSIDHLQKTKSLSTALRLLCACKKSHRHIVIYKLALLKFIE